ncbi:MAG: hypothetical protein JWO36_4974 [Myxococcales bacterium]|nr:hypothetical protein [Myxococcales bacterium]
MRARSAVLFTLALAAGARVTHADDDHPTRNPIPDVPPCIDGTDVVGYERCSRYGSWGQNLLEPYMFVDLGMNVRHFAAASGPSGVAYRGTRPVTTSGSQEAVTFDERLGVALSHALYLGLDFELGNFASLDESTSAAPDMLVAGLAAFGLRGGLGPIALAGEVAVGGMAYSFPSDKSLRTTELVEVRARGELWLSPWVTVGAQIGTSIVEKDQWIAGLYIGFHTYSYAGDR